MKILIVDDERMALGALENAIKKNAAQAQITPCHSAEEALREAEEKEFNIAFLDINMSGMNGVELAKKLTQRYPRLNIIFTTGYSEYMPQAFDLHVSGYLTKPITPAKIKKELEHLRYPLDVQSKRLEHPVYVRCFGDFEIFINGAPITFKYSKSKEVFAYLIDREGALCSMKAIISAIWEDDGHESYMRNVRKDLVDTLTAAGHGEVLETTYGGMHICPEMFYCDYYEWKKGNRYKQTEYRGEYMNQYSWAEPTNAYINISNSLK